METTHRVHVGDARSLDELDDNSVELVVTSPPYPMIELWDDLFATFDPEIESLLSAGEGRAAFDRMHSVLAPVWTELERVLVDGGVACINVGDATRSIDGAFQVYENHVKITEAMVDRGFVPLPDVLWRKPTNSAAKFMGSGMLPPNAYVTLEHEHVLVFRNGDKRRSFEAHDPDRYESAYFWEERNRWFTDVWTDLRGELQELPDDELRDRSAAFPFELPYRLINMYSAYGDTVFDPFWGTGTTTLAAMIAGRNSVGIEYDQGFLDAFEQRIQTVPDRADEVIDRRLERHQAFVRNRTEEGDPPQYQAEHYDFRTVTKQERSVRLYTVERLTETVCTDSSRQYRVCHRPRVSGPSDSE